MKILFATSHHLQENEARSTCHAPNFHCELRADEQSSLISWRSILLRVLLALVLVWSLSNRVAIGAPPAIYIQKEGTNAVVTWCCGTASLQIASSINGDWQTISNATSPFVVPLSKISQQYFRLAFPACTNNDCPLYFDQPATNDQTLK